MASRGQTLSKSADRSELSSALNECRNAFIGIGVMINMINILYLTGSFFMLEIYDRVLPSRSIPTLVGLIVLAGGPLSGARRSRHDPRTYPGAHRRQPR
jgi:ABC-type protease/lipase transport system fused ATPase/permease subunit